MKVLVADDDPISRHLLEVSLTNAGYEPTIVEDGADVLWMLGRKDTPRLMVLDWMMPHVDGLEVCRVIRHRASEHYTYLILVTAKEKQEDIVEGLEAGADDYITKPFDLQELRARLRTGKRILDLQEQLLSQAAHDSLTGFLNRKAILDTLQKEVVRAARLRNPLSVIMADVDHFKLINDAHGHPAGDAVLQETARRILGSIRAYDYVGRYGGEEFLIVIPECGVIAATELAERLRTRVEEEPVNASSHAIPITISLGVADTSTARNADELLRSADEALYAAKNRGRNRVEVTSGFKIA